MLGDMEFHLLIIVTLWDHYFYMYFIDEENLSDLPKFT